MQLQAPPPYYHQQRGGGAVSAPPPAPAASRPAPLARALVMGALHRSSEMVKRIRSVQELSASPALRSAFAPSIASGKPRREKAAFHFRGGALLAGGSGGVVTGEDNGPATCALGDMSAVHRRAEAAAGRWTGETAAAAAASAASAAAGTPAPQRRPATPTDKITTLTNNAALQSVAAATPGKLEMRARSSTPTADRIIWASQHHGDVAERLARTRKEMERHVLVPAASIVADDRRLVTHTLKERSRAHFYGAVLMAGGCGAGAGGELAAVLRAQRSATPDVTASPSTMPASAVADVGASQPAVVNVSPRMRRFVESERGTLAAEAPRPSGVPPTSLTRKSCIALSAFRSLQAATRQPGMSQPKAAALGASCAAAVAGEAGGVGTATAPRPLMALQVQRDVLLRR